jgi:hypothetical protein
LMPKPRGYWERVAWGGLALCWVAALITLLVIVTGCSAGTVQTYSPQPSPDVAASWPAPREDLTPGAVIPGCTYPRPDDQRKVTAATKHAVAARYGYTGPSGLAHVEYDHRVPESLCGADSWACPRHAGTCPAAEANIWPEPYDGAPTSRYVYNRKDQLEAVIAGKVRHHYLTLAQGQQVFLGDWRVAWCEYVHDPGVTC